jgi:hypothetical protein
VRARLRGKPGSAPGNPRESTYAPGDCQNQYDDGRCEHVRRYEIVVWSIGGGDWLRMRACGPCTDVLRVRHEHLGPGGTQGIARISEVPESPAAHSDRR